jgi:hypothetical protein
MKVTVTTAILAALISAPSAPESLETYRRKAMARDYDAQRNTAFCLRTGECEGIFVPRMMEACVWRMVILGSGHREVDASDTNNFRRECISSLSNQDRAAALTQAEQLFKEIYNRELPLKRLLPSWEKDT